MNSNGRDEKREEREQDRQGAEGAGCDDDRNPLGLNPGTVAQIREDEADSEELPESVDGPLVFEPGDEAARVDPMADDSSDGLRSTTVNNPLELDPGETH